MQQDFEQLAQRREMIHKDEQLEPDEILKLASKYAVPDDMEATAA